MHYPTGGRLEWLDGLRGIAACIVVLFHLTAGEVQLPYKSYWEESLEDRLIIQLPPFRIWIAGRAMVQLFFVISGYAIALSVNRKIDASPIHQYIVSSIVRKLFRLYIPVFLISVLSHILWYFELYSWDVLGPTCPEATPWSKIWPHFKCLLRYWLDVLNCIDPDLVRQPDRRGLNIAFWTIPYEVRGSIAVYLVLLALYQIRESTRIVIAATICGFHLWHGTIDLFPFFAGSLLGLLQYRFSGHPISILGEEKEQSEQQSSRSGTIIYTSTLLCGLFLMSFPFNEDRLAADWAHLKGLRSSAWRDDETYQVCWFTIGATMIIASLHELESARWFLQSGPMKFLGRLSFSLYLIHITVLSILRKHVLNFLCWTIIRRQYDAEALSPRIFTLAWMLCIAIHFAILIPLAAYSAAHLDGRSVVWARQLERRLRRG